MKGGLVLAGGKSTRFGSNRALVRLGEKPLIAHVVDVALHVADEVVVAIGRESSTVVYRKNPSKVSYSSQGPIAREKPLGWNTHWSPSDEVWILYCPALRDTLCEIVGGFCSPSGELRFQSRHGGKIGFNIVGSARSL